MYNIKAVPTNYKNQTFRSRIEAKWAVLFDLLGIKWIYEPDGFELKTGKYLPDFYLPEYECFVEVKPYYIRNNKNVEAWLDKGFEVSDATGKCFLFLFGNPNLKTTIVFYPDNDFGPTQISNVIPFCDISVPRYGRWFYSGYEVGNEDSWMEEEFISEILKANSYNFK